MHGLARLIGRGARRGDLGRMAALELRSVLLARKERGHRGKLAVVYRMLHQVLKGRNAHVKVYVCLGIGEHIGRAERKRRAVRHDDLRVLGNHAVVLTKIELFGENARERGVIGERAALEDDRRLDVDTLREAADRLARNGMEGRERQVLTRYALIEQRLDIRLGIHAATAGNLVHRGAACGKLLETLGGNTQQLGHLVDERARAARAAAVHAHVGDDERSVGLCLVEEDHLGVLAAKLDCASYLRVEFAYCDGVCHDLLDVSRAERPSDVARARSRYRHAQASARETLAHLAKRLDRAQCLAGVVTLVTPIPGLVRSRVEDEHLGGGRANVEPYVQHLIQRRATRGTAPGATRRNAVRLRRPRCLFHIPLHLAHRARHARRDAFEIAARAGGDAACRLPERLTTS